MKLNELNVVPENYGLEILPELPQEAISSSLMLDCHRKFINGLIRLYKPKRVLEIGVASGGGSCVVLNAIKDLPDSKLYSIDVATKIHMTPNRYKNDESCDVGYTAKKLYDNLIECGRFNLFVGKDPSLIIEGLGEKFDFCIIDTAHLHPIETFNFLTALPFLTDGAIVVLDDVLLYYESGFPYFATRLLYDSVVGNKLQINGTNYAENNVVAFQISSDTYKYIGNVFDSLFFPWLMLTDELDTIGDFIKRHYDRSFYDKFQTAKTWAYKGLVRQSLNINNDWFEKVYGNISKRTQTQSLDYVKSKLEGVFAEANGKTVIYYGAGHNYKCVTKVLDKLNFVHFLPKYIFDKNAERIKVVDGVSVEFPRFDDLRNENDFLLITLGDKVESDKIAEQLSQIGFHNFIQIEQLEFVL